MDSRRRHVIAAAVLVPAGPLVLLNVAEWGAAGLTAGAVGGLVAMPATAGLVYAVLRGLDRRTGTAAVFVLAWGAVVLASAVGESAAALAANELAARAETAQPWEDSGEGSAGGPHAAPPPSGHAEPTFAPGGAPLPAPTAEPTGAPTAGTAVQAAVAVSAAPALGGSVLPYGTAALTLMLGWVPALSGTVAYRRTRPRAQDGTGASGAA
ncbi:hypothetical protein ACFPZ0_03685 [Streptomonospora nanhaiensis]|uniref:Uncharacterized protein n=1 Tax=Streptomonospora nanhaiensis TaxID=1323731 RepID=A0A853BNJ9_9ACTN|nr:hypothetical protein [Streptomonospora nanhaiensis]MBV2361962.1 hypothetical protein [Streptomonospora nanhaiensis]MBX9386806.1 hypothetical protein [Streptomonospora nanhaiensis]NYI96217.1 hypothetical protein [Streptomonospora nanhaiensis]